MKVVLTTKRREYARICSSIREVLENDLPKISSDLQEVNVAERNQEKVRFVETAKTPNGIEGLVDSVAQMNLERIEKSLKEKSETNLLDKSQDPAVDKLAINMVDKLASSSKKSMAAEKKTAKPLYGKSSVLTKPSIPGMPDYAKMTLDELKVDYI